MSFDSDKTGMLETELLFVSDITPNDFNPNKMSSKTFGKLKASVERFGLLEPLLVRLLPSKGKAKGKHKYQIIDGEHRWKVFNDLGRNKIPAKVLDVSEDEMKEIILTTTIKGKLNYDESMSIIKDIVSKEDNNLARACNLEKDDIIRKLAFSDYDKAKLRTDVTKPKKKRSKRGDSKEAMLRDETNSNNTKPLDTYKVPLILFVPKSKYEKVKKIVSKYI